MASLQPMPPVAIAQPDLASAGAKWQVNAAFDGKENAVFSAYLDNAVGHSMSVMLGNIPIEKPNQNQLLPVKPDCVEVGPVRVVGGVRPQNFDVGYRPDGIRIAYDSKTLNDDKSVGKNWQNMVNDLGTEATTVHIRFSTAVVGFIVAIPLPCMANARRTNAMIGTLTRLGGRKLVSEPLHRAEAMSLLVWDPSTGTVDPNVPDPASPLRIERFSDDVYDAYHDRFQGLPPHAI